MKVIFILFAALVLLPFFCRAEEISSSVDWEAINYSLGHQIGSDLKRQGMEINPEVLSKGVLDASSGKAAAISEEEMQGLLAAVKRKIMEDKRAEIAGRSKQQQENKEKYRGEGRDFLEENAKKEGVVSLPSGLQYKVIKEGTGKTPGPSDTVSVRYRGTLIDGTEFSNSSSQSEPENFGVEGVIPGWREALQLMREGAKWQLFIPSDLAFGERGPLADRTVIFDIELVSTVAAN